MTRKNKRILVFNVNWLGDVLFSTAAIRNIKYNYPGSYLACIVPSRCYQVLKGNPHLDEIIIFDEKDRHKGIVSKLAFVKFLKSKKFDTVFLLHKSFSRALICRIAGIPERIGHYTKKRGFLLTKKFKPPAPESLHRIDYYLDVIEKAGLKVEDRYTEFFFEEKDEELVLEFLKKNNVKKGPLLVGLNPAGNWLPKRWPETHWAQLADKLIASLGATVIITGSVADMPLAKRITSHMKEKPVIACGHLNLKQLAALCKKLDVFVTADTGPLHIANSVGTKNIIAIFGPTDPKVTGPFPGNNALVLKKDVGCKIPCYEVDCKLGKCMAAVTPDEVFERIKSLKK